MKLVKLRRPKKNVASLLLLHSLDAKPMIFHAGPWQYRVSLADDLRHWEDGDPLMGLCQESGRKILIAKKCPHESRLWVLLHELCHAAMFSSGNYLPPDVESACDFFAFNAAQAIVDLVGNGVLDLPAAKVSRRCMTAL